MILNARNFGHIRSPMHALYQATGDAVIGIVADLQDPPEMIVDLIRKWEEGYSGGDRRSRRTSEENRPMFWLRKKYYRLVKPVSSASKPTKTSPDSASTTAAWWKSSSRWTIPIRISAA